MKQFRLPRKVRKSLKRDLWLYPADDRGNSLMAFPTRSQDDYIALKQGIVKNIQDHGDAKTKAERKALKEKLDSEVIVSDEELKRYVDDIVRKDFRVSFYNILVAARDHPKAVVAFYNFVNAYQLYEKGDDSFGNICCLSVDKAKSIMKGGRKK